MAGYLDDLINLDDVESKEPQAGAPQPKVEEEEPKGPTGNGGDARASLYGDEFMKRYGGRGR